MEGKFLPGFGVLVPRPPTQPPVPTIPVLTRRRKLPPIKTRTMKKHKGAYSDIVTSFKFEVKKIKNCKNCPTCDTARAFYKSIYELKKAWKEVNA